jgi:gliding motility-associated-like protein
MSKRSIIFNLLLALNLQVFCQTTCPPFPEMETTPVLTYVRLPPSAAPNTIRFLYRITVDCNQTPNIYDLGIADFKYPDSIKFDVNFQLDSFVNVTGVLDPCVVLPVPPCRSTYYYHVDAPLYNNTDGFLAATANCCRPYGAVNLGLSFQSNLNFTLQLSPGLWCPPGPPCEPCTGPVTNAMISYIKVPPFSIPNNSAQITSHDTLLTVCKNRPFSYRIQATDPDGDSIAYHFSAPRTFNATPYDKQVIIQLYLPYPMVAFTQPYSATDPAGANLTLDPLTGTLQGFIADTGAYDVPISAMEYRNGVLLDSVMLDQFVNVYDCSQLPKPTASLPSLLAECNSYTVSFPNNSSPLYPANNWNNTTFQWEFGDGGSSQLVNPSHTYSDTGAYQTSLVIFPGLWCADTAYSKVLVYPFVQASFTHNDSCLGQPVLFTSTSTSSGGPIVSNHWDILQDSVSLDSSDNPTITYAFRKAPQTYTVLLTVETDKGCLNTDTQYVNIWPAPLPLPTHDTVLANGATLQLHANDGNFNHNGLFRWSPPEGLNDPDTADPVVNYDKAITYSVYMQNAYGCSLQDSIHIIYYAGPNIYVPNAFTPNGDGRNDIFRPLVVGFSAFSYFRVFNRNGQLLYETSQPGQGWDGTANSRPAPAGTYVWEAAGIDAFTNKLFIKSGTVILIR